MTPNEIRRRIFHMSPGLLPFVLWWFPHRDPISPTLMSIMIGSIVGIGAMIFVSQHRIRRSGDQENFLNAVLGYTGSVLLTLILFPAHPELSLTVLAILAFGDGSATLGGLLLRGPALPWNRKKSWSGTLCFVLCGSLLASVIYWGEAQPRVSFGIAMLCGSSAALVAAIVESMPSRVNDNIRAGLSAAVTVAAVHGLVVGWA